MRVALNATGLCYVQFFQVQKPSMEARRRQIVATKAYTVPVVSLDMSVMVVS